MTGILDRPLVPLADPDDAVATYRELRPYLLESEIVPLVVHVVEKAGGAPDKIGVEQRTEYAEEIFEAFRNRAELDGIDVDSTVLYGTDVAETVHDAATEYDVSAIVFRSRGQRRWIELVTGNARANLVAGGETPVLVLPDTETGADR